jgi:hypothetical protein
MPADGPGASAGHQPGCRATLAALRVAGDAADPDGHRVIWADAEELQRQRELHRLPGNWASKARLAELKKSMPGPAR